MSTMPMQNPLPGSSGDPTGGVGGVGGDPLSDLLAALTKRRALSSGALIPPGSAAQAIGGAPGHFGGFGHGPFTFMPGPIQQSYPGMALLGELAASGALPEILLALGGGPRTSVTSTRRKTANIPKGG